MSTNVSSATGKHDLSILVAALCAIVPGLFVVVAIVAFVHGQRRAFFQASALGAISTLVLASIFFVGPFNPVILAELLLLAALIPILRNLSWPYAPDPSPAFAKALCIAVGAGAGLTVLVCLFLLASTCSTPSLCDAYPTGTSRLRIEPIGGHSSFDASTYGPRYYDSVDHHIVRIGGYIATEQELFGKGFSAGGLVLAGGSSGLWTLAVPHYMIAALAGFAGVLMILEYRRFLRTRGLIQ